MDASGVASASFLVSSRDWKGKRQVQASHMIMSAFVQQSVQERACCGHAQQAENLWKVTKQLNDEDAGCQQTTACPSMA